MSGGKSPEDKGLNPNALAFAPGPGAARGGGARKGYGQPAAAAMGSFSMNPEATPWLPTSYQSQKSSKKPVIIIFGAPGSGVVGLGKGLAKQFSGVFHSSWLTKQHATEEKKTSFDNRPTSIWGDTKDALKELDCVLEATHKDPKVKCYFLDIHCRNNAVFHYVSFILGQYGLAPGQVLYLTGLSKETCIENAVKAGEEKVHASKQLDFYLQNEAERLSVFNGVKGLVTRVDGTLPEAKLLETAVHHTNIVCEKVLSFSLPHTVPSHGLIPINNIAEYHHVLSILSEKISGGDPRFPGTRDVGTFQNVDGKIVNPKGEVPKGDSHKVFKKTDGSRYLLVYTPHFLNMDEGKFYLVPKAMDVIYTFKPRIGDVEYEGGKAPLYGEANAINTMILDGELVKMKAGWGGLVGMGCQQSLYIASDILYFEAEKPRDRISKSDHWTLDRRLELLSRTKWPHDEVAPSDTTTVSLCVRSYYHLSKLPSLLESIAEQNNNYKTVGLGFTPAKRYQPYADSSLITWCSWPSKQINLKVAQNGSVFNIYAKRGWGESAETKIGTASESVIRNGNAACRIIWDDQRGGSYRWVVDGPAHNCWEEAGVKEYVNSKNWVSTQELQEQLYTPPPPEPERKARVEKVNDEAEEPIPEEPKQASGRGKGASGRGSGRGR
eukprot:TRINITY_DN522_c5_g1_i1.p1 TRINITY_DN522_c5_g1~~TRINITY_DN522_c5_g1_i1.p1  ORF type:complete len:684 (+),score=129.93 TRINITY_DN522_c5_g1_i1:61-2052(+)